ncbi:MAG: rhodanese-like domain-containing protein [Deltaproteobacteria bacterium]
MKKCAGILLRAAIIVVVASSIGIAVNLVSPQAIPWVYTRPKEIVAAGVAIPIISENKAHELLDNGRTIFIDARHQADFTEGHVKGAFSLPAPEKEDRFVELQAMLPEESRVIVYCGGPECEMADKVAGFLAQLGYKKVEIMREGFSAWKKAGYPVESDVK